MHFLFISLTRHVQFHHGESLVVDEEGLLMSIRLQPIDRWREGAEADGCLLIILEQLLPIPWQTNFDLIAAHWAQHLPDMRTRTHDLPQNPVGESSI